MLHLVEGMNSWRSGFLKASRDPALNSSLAMMPAPSNGTGVLNTPGPVPVATMCPAASWGCVAASTTARRFAGPRATVTSLLWALLPRQAEPC